MVRTMRILGLAVLLGAAAPAQPVFTQAQHDQIIAIVRQALKDDPSILRDAVTTLRADDEAQQAADTRNTIAARHKDLYDTFGDAQAGNPKGDVTVVEFYDPRCPYCRKMLPGITQMLQQDHNVRWVFKDIPVLGEASVLEVRAILAAQKQGAYEKMQSELMANPAQPDDQMIADTARDIGLNPKQLLVDMDSKATTDRIKSNLALARALKVDGTPTFVVGDQVIPGMADVDSLQTAIAQARKHS